MIQCPPEKLGSFFLGAEYNIDKKEVTQEVINYDSRDLTTHAVCVGMTGSGKTGLCVGLLEEAAMDDIPAIIIDPKGDMTNLLLNFDELTPDQFKPWINADDANRKGLSIDEFAQQTAEKWKNGLASWGQGLDRIKALKESVDYTIYTPGSDAGIPINILGSFAAPKVDFETEAEMLRERIQGTVAALLGMIDSKEDPVRSREGILLATLFEHYWVKGEDLDMAKLITGIQNPPVKQLGVFDVDTFFPQKDRFQLAMDFNTLVASPQFSYWLKGDPLDIEKIYFTPEGKPRHSIFYIAHLSESERMFFVTLLLNSVITWMRRQSGTSSLRSLLYFDEIFGYFPPTKNPPSKKPMLTILKQARAFGVGAVLVTQNPVDIDYKGLSNAGTWFIGKLQTERDKMRVLDGLKGAIAEAGNDSNIDFDKLITSLTSRVFLYHNVHESAPKVFNTRWVMSYLRGPLTRPQVKQLMQQKKSERKDKVPVKNTSTPGQTAIAGVSSNQPPSLDPSIPQKFFAVWKSASEAADELGSKDLNLEYEAMVLALGKVRFYDAKSGIDKVKGLNNLALAPDEFGRVDWDLSLELTDGEYKLLDAPDHADNTNPSYNQVPDSMDSVKEIKTVGKEFENWIYQSQKHTILAHPKLKVVQSSDETEAGFKSRVKQLAREERDEELDELQEKYAAKIEKIEDKIRKEEFDLEQAQSEVRSRRTQEMVGVAETIFSVFVKGRSRSFSSSATKRRMSRKASEKLEESKADLEELDQDMADLQNELKEKLSEIRQKWDELEAGLSKKEITPRRTDIKLDQLMLVWHPFWVNSQGKRTPARR